MLSRIVLVDRDGLRLGEAGVFTRTMAGLAMAGAEPQTVTIDATYLKAHRMTSSLRVKREILAG